MGVPAFLHVSHAKAGSTWIDHILHAAFDPQVAPRFGSDLARLRFDDGKIYSSAFLTRDQVVAHPGLAKLPRFFILRDLRDATVSKYFSVKVSHTPDAAGAIARQRQLLNERSLEDGLAWMIETGMNGIAGIQRSWLGHGERILRYEDLIADDVALLSQLLLGDLRLPVDPAKLEQAIVANRFEKVFGRKMGEADTKSHGRQGAAGDWKNHFSPALRQAFHERFGDLLIATGYEKDDSWVE